MQIGQLQGYWSTKVVRTEWIEESAESRMLEAVKPDKLVSRPGGLQGRCRGGAADTARGGIRTSGSLTDDLHGEVTAMKVPKLPTTLPFETAIIERYHRREASVEEALGRDVCSQGSVSGASNDITEEAGWGTRVSSGCHS